MNIMVFNVPAESVGALSILNDLINDIEDEGISNKNDKWQLIVSTPEILINSNNLKVFNYPWVKKSWIYRILFDLFKAPWLIYKHKPDLVISLQNITIPFTKKPQILYIHNSIPYSNMHFSIKDNPKLWVYKNVMSKLINISVKKSSKILVQSKWMKDIIIEKNNINKEKIEIISPVIKRRENLINNGVSKNFFYPASAFKYKNHHLIIEACKRFKREEKLEFKVFFTLTGMENDYAIGIKKEIEKYELPIILVGNLSRDEVFNYYSKTILIFPSLLETFGLPLAEARTQGCIVLGSNLPFTNEVLHDYENYYTFNPENAEELADLMHWVLNNNVKQNNTRFEIKESKNIVEVINEFEGK